jgi:hypothetical protein
MRLRAPYTLEQIAESGETGAMIVKSWGQTS